MYQHRSIEGGKGNSQKGKSSLTGSVACRLQSRDALFYVDSITDSISYMYIQMLPIFKYF
jgi:hypothetical protein